MSTHCVGWAAPSSSAGTACGHVHTQQAVQLQVCVPPVAQRRIGCRHNDEEHYNTERHRHLQQPAVGVQGVWWLRRRVGEKEPAGLRNAPLLSARVRFLLQGPLLVQFAKMPIVGRQARAWKHGHEHLHLPYLQTQRQLAAREACGPLRRCNCPVHPPRSSPHAASGRLAV